MQSNRNNSLRGPLQETVLGAERSVNSILCNLSAMRNGTSFTDNAITSHPVGSISREASYNQWIQEWNLYGDRLDEAQERFFNLITSVAIPAFGDTEDTRKPNDLLTVLEIEKSEKSARVGSGGLLKAAIHYWNSAQECELTGQAKPGDVILDMRLSTQESRSRSVEQIILGFQQEVREVFEMAEIMSQILPNETNVIVCFALHRDLFELMREGEGRFVEEKAQAGNAAIINSPLPDNCTDLRWNMVRNRILSNMIKAGMLTLLPNNEGIPVYNPERASKMEVVLVAVKF